MTRSTMSILGVALMIMGLCSNLQAQTPLEGKKAPNFTVGKTINDTHVKSLDDVQGEVVLIKYWGTQ